MTYNINRGKADENLFKLVFDQDLKDESQLADIYTIGFQEIAALHLTFPSWTRIAIQNWHQSMTRALSTAVRSIGSSQTSLSSEEIDPGQLKRYSLVASPAHGGLGLLVYARDDTVFPHISKVQTSSASCGFLNLMNNKGAVGVRLSLHRHAPDQDHPTVTSNQEESITFINAHLTAHDSGILARNRDYQTIHNRLMFQSPGGEEHSIYDTHHLFFMGDLNYRISLNPLNNLNSMPITKQNLSDIIRENRHPSLFPDHETLSHEHSCQKVLVGLKEPAILFKPTYKYKRGKPNEFVSFNHRLPGWTDRIFYASSLDLQKSNDQHHCLNVVEYQSVEHYHSSDHKPVFAVFDLPCYHESKVSKKFLTNRPPIRIDKWRVQKRTIGFLLDQSCGIILLSAALVGFGNMTLGAINLAVLVGFGWKFYRGS